VKFKLDENFGTHTQNILRESGYDTQTVRMESLQGLEDEKLYEICRTEQRCLITLDLDFANVLRFPPDQTGGIVVIRVPHNPSLIVLEGLAREFLKALKTMNVEQKLWVVEVGRIRVHQADTEDFL
jgi:predicted nuclease of predicted toxin-antitoxin system